MKVLGKVVLAIVIFVALFIGSIFLYLRVGYEIASREACTQKDAVNGEELKKRIRETNTSTDPYIVLKLNEAEFQYVINDILKEQDITTCVRIANRSISLLASRNPFLWVQANVDPINETPFMKISKIHWDVVTFPGVFEESANKSLKDGFDSYFGGSALASRYFDRLEIDDSTILIYSSIKK